MVKKEHGITLIALIVTIVVLIIVALIAINMTIGDNGIITIAQETARKANEMEKSTQEDINELEQESVNDMTKPVLPAGQDYEIKIQSNVVMYNESFGEFPVIYSIKGVKNGENVYDDMVLLTMGKTGNNDNNIMVFNVPSETTITIQPIYCGASYNLASEPTQTITLEADNSAIQTVNFEYNYNGKIIANKGIQ